jgi:lysophospholipase L1-like esterase
MNSPKAKKIAKVLVVNLIVLVLLVAGAEVAVRIGYRQINGRSIFADASVFGQVFERHPYLVGQLRKSVMVESAGKRITTTARNTRWTGAPDDDRDRIKVALLGGSTTFCTGVTDKDSWPAILQEQLGPKYSVINYGMPGFSTAENIIQLALIVPEARPSVVVLYEGWNDIHNYHDTALSPDYYAHGMQQYGTLNLNVPGGETSLVRLIQKIYDSSAVLTLVNQWRYKRSVQAAPKPTQVFRSDPDPAVDRLYVRNLKTLRLLSENIADCTLFVPQVMNNTVGSNKNRSWVPHIASSAMPDLMRRFNGLMETACDGGGAKCLYVADIAKAPWAPDDFIDDGHFTQKGCAKFASIIAETIKSRQGSH